MKKGTQVVVHSLILMAICTGILIFSIYPQRPRSWLGWVALIVLSVPTVAGIQLLGQVSLGAKYLERVPRFIRILVGIVLILAFAIGVWVVFKGLSPYLTTW